MKAQCSLVFFLSTMLKDECSFRKQKINTLSSQIFQSLISKQKTTKQIKQLKFSPLIKTESKSGKIISLLSKGENKNK